MQKAKQAAKHTLRQVLGSEEIEEIVNNKAKKRQYQTLKPRKMNLNARRKNKKNTRDKSTSTFKR